MGDGGDGMVDGVLSPAPHWQTAFPSGPGGRGRGSCDRTAEIQAGSDVAGDVGRSRPQGLLAECTGPHRGLGLCS